MRSFILFAVTGLVFLAGGCRTSFKQAGSELTKADNSMNSLDWPGVYSGILPCADCDGIETVVIIHKDLSYRVQTKYIGKSEDVFDKSGTFVWNKAGSGVELLGIPAGSMPTRFQVGENQLIQLDLKGKKITGELASSYILKKSVAATASASVGGNMAIPLIGTKWKLIELRGEKVVRPADSKEDAYIQLTTDGRMSAYANCNRMSGGYELKEGLRIKFIGVISTMMACPDMKTEQGLGEVLHAADNYSLNGTRMTLNKAKMAPLAVFEVD